MKRTQGMKVNFQDILGSKGKGSQRSKEIKKRSEKKSSTVTRVSDISAKGLFSLYVYSTPVPVTSASGHMAADHNE